LEPLVEQVIEKVGKPEAVAADAAYQTPTITSYLFNKEITPALPYTRTRTKEGFYCKHDYVYDKHFDCYLCHFGRNFKVLKQQIMRAIASTNAKTNLCNMLIYLSRCTESKDQQKEVTRNIWQASYALDNFKGT
jgi:hypothetical protein